MNQNQTPEMRHIRFNTWTALYCPMPARQLCRDISDQLTVANLRVAELTTDLANVRADLRRAVEHLSPKPSTVSVVPAGIQQRGVEQLPEG